MSALAGALDKLAEARFFLALLNRIKNGQPITTEPLDSEATYFTSALLNACYSILEQLRCQGKRALRAAERHQMVDQLETAVENTFLQNPDLYHEGPHGSGTKECGIRHLSVHIKPVLAGHHDSTLGTYGSTRYGSLMYGESRLEHHLYVNHPVSEAPVWIVPRMTKHVRELEELVTSWGNLID